MKRAISHRHNTGTSSVKHKWRQFPRLELNSSSKLTNASCTQSFAYLHEKENIALLHTYTYAHFKNQSSSNYRATSQLNNFISYIHLIDAAFILYKALNQCVVYPWKYKCCNDNILKTPLVTIRNWETGTICFLTENMVWNRVRDRIDVRTTSRPTLDFHMR